MFVTKQNIRKGRYDIPEAVADAMRRTLAALPERKRAAALTPRRVAALVACAAVLACAVAFASFPSARAYAAGLIRSVFRLHAGQAGNGFIALPSESPDAGQAASADPLAAYEQGMQDKYKIIAANSVPVDKSQTANSIKATVLEAAILDGKLFLGLEFDDVPEYCFPEEETISIWVDGEKLNFGSLRQTADAGGPDVFTVETPLSMKQKQLPKSFTVRLAFSLRQFPDGGTGQGNVVANFDMSFPMDKPAKFATLPPEKNGVEKDQASTTAMPLKDGQRPADDQRLIEPEGVAAWAKYANTGAGITFEYPAGWAEDSGAPILPELKDSSALLAAFKGSGGSVRVYAVQLDAGAVDASSAADRASSLFASGASGDVYEIDGKEVYFLFAGWENKDDSCIIIKLDNPVSVGGKTYGFLYVWAPADYNAHILKSLVIG